MEIPVRVAAPTPLPLPVAVRRESGSGVSLLLRACLVFSITFSALLLLALAFGQALPRGGQIAYTSTLDGLGDIYLADVERGISLNLTRTPESDIFPVWSPDGNRIAFRQHAADSGIIGNLYLLNLETGSRLNLTNSDAYYDIPVWSPDGSQLAYVTNRYNDFEIYLLDMNCPDSCDARPLTANIFRDYAPAWSPDGATLVFLSYIATGRNELRSVNADGSNPHNLSYRTLPSDQTPRWSPDGEHILVTVWDGTQFDIYRMDAACIPDTDAPEREGPRNCERTLQNLTQNSFDDWSPAWSSDSRQIAFLSNRDGGTEIYRMDAGTGDVLRLTDNVMEDRDVVWSPDGARIAFTSNVDGDFEIFVMDADGGHLRRLTYNAGADFAPVWRPE